MAETEGKERFLKKAERKACWDAKESFYFILNFIHNFFQYLQFKLFCFMLSKLRSNRRGTCR